MPLGVLFMQSQAFFGADSAIHAQLMKYFDRSLVEVHVAVTTEEPANPAMSALRRGSAAIPNVHVRRDVFGPSIHGVGPGDRLKQVAGGVEARQGSWRRWRVYQAAPHQGHPRHREAARRALWRAAGQADRREVVVHMHVGYGDWLARTVKWALGQADAHRGHLALRGRVARRRGLPTRHASSSSTTRSTWLEVGPDLDGPSVRHELGVPAAAPVVGIASRLFKWKGHGYLVDAMAQVIKELPEARLVIVGEDDPRRRSGKRQLSRPARGSRPHALGIDRQRSCSPASAPTCRA